jgi:hypothetical protein
MISNIFKNEIILIHGVTIITVRMDDWPELYAFARGFIMEHELDFPRFMSVIGFPPHSSFYQCLVIGSGRVPSTRNGTMGLQLREAIRKLRDNPPHIDFERLNSKEWLTFYCLDNSVELVKVGIQMIGFDADNKLEVGILDVRMDDLTKEQIVEKYLPIPNDIVLGNIYILSYLI